MHIESASAIFKLTVVDCQSLRPTVPLPGYMIIMCTMMMMRLLAGIWESNVREEKEENADDKEESKQAAHNQLHFPFHLWPA